MRLCVTFQTTHPIFLPWDYLELLQGLFYSAIKRVSPRLGAFLHEQGYEADQHRYKFVTFSWLYPKSAQHHTQGLLFHGPILWWLSSPSPAPLEAMAVWLLEKGKVTLGNSLLTLQHIFVEPEPDFSKSLLVKTLSPIVVSTGVVEGGKMKHLFLSPQDPGFERIINDNLKRKAKAMWGIEIKDGFVRFEPIAPCKSKLVTVKGTEVRGYEGKFRIEGTEALVRLGYQAGFGERNLQGFGMVETIKR